VECELTQVVWKGVIKEGENPVRWSVCAYFTYEAFSMSRVVWECCPKIGGKSLLKLNIRSETDSEQVV